MRAAIAGAIAGEERTAPLAALGLSGLCVSDGSGREVVRLGSVEEGASHRRLEAGTASYELALWPPVTEEQAAPVAFLLETMLFRGAASRSRPISRKVGRGSA